MYRYKVKSSTTDFRGEAHEDEAMRNNIQSVNNKYFSCRYKLNSRGLNLILKPAYKKLFFLLN